MNQDDTFEHLRYKITTENGTIRYHNAFGEPHREDGPAVIHSDGSEEWYLNGKLHREGGPAVYGSGVDGWFINGKLHREGGPAVEFTDGHGEYWVNGDHKYSQCVSKRPSVVQRILNLWKKLIPLIG